MRALSHVPASGPHLCNTILSRSCASRASAVGEATDSFALAFLALEGLTHLQVHLLKSHLSGHRRVRANKIHSVVSLQREHEAAIFGYKWIAKGNIAISYKMRRVEAILRALSLVTTSGRHPATQHCAARQIDCYRASGLLLILTLFLTDAAQPPPVSSLWLLK